MSTLRFGLAVLLSLAIYPGTHAEAKGTGVSISSYVAIRGAQKIDDRCHLLTADERKLVDGYMTLEQRRIQLQDPNFTFNDALLTGANNMSCDQGKAIVMDVYNDASLKTLGLRRTTLVLAMKVGERCGLLSSDEDNRLRNGVRRIEEEARSRAGQEGLGDVSALDGKIEQRSLQFSCSDARPNLDEALKAVSQ